MKTQLFDKAKSAADAVADTAEAVKDTIADKAASVANAVSAKSSEAVHAIAAKIGELKDAVFERANATVGEINALLPYLEKLGFNLDEMNIELGIPTKLSLVLRKVSDKDAGIFEELLRENADKTLFCAVVKLLYQTNALAGKITFRNIEFSHIEVDIGIAPSARVKFVEKSKAN